MPRPLFPSAPIVEAVPLVEETKAAPKAEPTSARPKTPAPTQETPPVKPASEPIKPAVAAPVKAAKAAKVVDDVPADFELKSETVETTPSVKENIWSAEDREEFLAQLNERTAGMEYEEAKKQIAPTLIAYSAAKGSDPAKEMAAATLGNVDIHAISHDVLRRRGPAEDSLLRRTLMPAATTPEAKAKKATLAAVEDAPVAAFKTKREADQIATIRAATKADPEKAVEETAIKSQSIPAIALSERTTDFFGDDPTKDPEVAQGVMQDWAKGMVAQIPKEHALDYVSGFNRVTADSSKLIGDNAERILRERGITLETNGIKFVVRSRNPQDIKQRYVEAGGKIEDLGATEAERVASADNAAAEAYRRAYAKAINEIAALRTTGGITSPVRISIPYSKLLGISPEGTFSFSDEVPRLMLPEGDGWGPKDIIKERGVAGYLEAALNAAAPRMEIVGFKRGSTPEQQAILLRQSGAAETWLDRLDIFYNINKEIAGGTLDRKGLPFYKDEETGEWTMYGPNDFVGNVLEGFANRENAFEDVQNNKHVNDYLNVVTLGPVALKRLGVEPPEQFLYDYNDNGEIDDEDKARAWDETKAAMVKIKAMALGGTAAVLAPDVIDFGVALDAPAALRRARTAFQANPAAIDLLKVEADALAVGDYEKAQETAGLLGKREGISRSSDTRVEGSAPDLSTTVLITDTAVALEARAAGKANEMFDTDLIERLPAVRYPDSELDITIPRDNHIHGSQQSTDASRRARYDLVEKNNNLDAMEEMVAKGEGNFPELQVKAANANLRQLLADGVDKRVVAQARALIRQGKFNDAQTLIKGMTNQDHIDLLTEAAELASEARLKALEEAPEAIERARAGVRQQAESRRQAAQEVYDWVRHNDEKGALAQRLDKIAPWFTRQTDRFRAARSVTEFWRRAGLEQVADVAVSEKKRAQIEKAAKDLTNARKTLLQARENASKAISAAEVNRWNDRIDKAGERLRERADKYAAIAAGFKLEGLSPAGQRLFARVLEVTDELNITVEQALIAVLQAEWNARRVVEEGRANSLDEVLDTYEFRLGGDPNAVGGEVLRAEEEAKRLARVVRGEGERVFGKSPLVEPVEPKEYNSVDELSPEELAEAKEIDEMVQDYMRLEDEEAEASYRLIDTQQGSDEALAISDEMGRLRREIGVLGDALFDKGFRGSRLLQVTDYDDAAYRLPIISNALRADRYDEAVKAYAAAKNTPTVPPRIQRNKAGAIIKGPTNAIKEVTPISLDPDEMLQEVRDLPWFHGTANAEAQMKDYDYRIHSGTGAGNMFGPGKYLASNPERAIDYAAMSGKPLGSGTAGKSTVRALDVKPERLLDIRMAAAKKKGLTLGEYVAEQLKAGGVEEDLARQFRGARDPEEIGDILNRFKEPARVDPPVPEALATAMQDYQRAYLPSGLSPVFRPYEFESYALDRLREIRKNLEELSITPEVRGALMKEESVLRAAAKEVDAYLDLPPVIVANRFEDIVMKFDGLLHLGRKDGNVLVLFDPNGKINGRAILKSESRILPDEVLYQMDDLDGTPLPPGTKTISVDGVERPALNSNGQPIHPTVEGVENFWRWFGDSKVVDGEGRPLVVYHGSPKPGHDVFTPREITAAGTGEALSGSGIYFTNVRSEAVSYAGENGGVYPAYIAAKRPFIRGKDTWSERAIAVAVDYMSDKINPQYAQRKAFALEDGDFLASVLPPNVITRMLRADGYDSVIDGHIKVALDSTQVKSALGNKGTFSPDDASILRQNEEPPTNAPRTMTLFSGGGLVEVGLKGLINPVAAVEYNGDIADVYRKAHGDHVQAVDVRDVDYSKQGQIDYLHASPVCTRASKANVTANGECAIDIETAQATAKAIRELRPKVFTLENVADYKDFSAMKIIIEALREAGYKFDADIYNAADYGASTSRKRLLLRAVLEGELPPPPTKVAQSGDWFADIEDLVDSLPDDAGLAPWQKQRFDAKGINYATPDRPMIVMGGSAGANTVPHAYAGQPAPTIKATSGEVHRLVLPDGRVKRLSERALARITGLPDDYPLPESGKLARTIVGNGVPPKLAREVFGPLLTRTTPTDNLNQQAKAFVQFTADGKKIVHLMKTADFSSLTHELGHIFRRNLSVKDNAIVEKWVKAQGLDATIDPTTSRFIGKDAVEAEERFARGYERWVREGKSPLKAMQPIYDKMKQWMLSIYKGLTNTSINVTLSPDIEMVFARMVTPDSLMDTVAPSITGERLAPKAGKAPMSAAAWLSDQLKAKGIDLSAADIQARWNAGESVDLPFKVGGKSTMSPDDALAIQLAVDSVAALQARKADFTTAYDDTRQSVMEETLVDDIQAGLSAPDTAREEMALGSLGRWGVKGLARAAATVTLGADAVKNSRLFSPRVRDLAKQAERTLNQRVGDFNVLLREIQEGNYDPLFDYLTGNETVFAVGGRRPLSTGHDAAREAGNIIGDMHQGFPFRDSDGKPIMLKVLPDNAGTAGNQQYIKLDGDVTDNIAEAAEPQQVMADLIGLMMQTMKEHPADAPTGKLVQKVKSLMANKQVSGALRPAMAYMLEGSPFVRHIAHAVFKPGNDAATMDAAKILEGADDSRIFALVDALFKLNGASVEKVGGAFEVSFDPDLTSYHNLAEFIEAMRKGGFNTEHVNRALAVINVFGSYSTAHKAVEEVGYSFTKAQRAIHQKFLKGQVEDPVEFAEGLRMFAEFGYNYDALDEVATMIEGQPTMRYIPGDIQRRIGAALGRALDEDTQSTKKLADAVAKPPAVARWLVGLHQRDLARGVYLAKGPKAVMDLTDTFAMNAIAGGTKHAAAVTARQIVQTMFASLQGHVLTKVVSLGSQALGKGPVSSDDVRMLAQRLGDMLSDNLTMAKVQIDTNEIVKGSDKIIDMGDGRRYKASDLLAIAIRNGTVASFESSEIKASVRKSLELKLANDAAFAERVLGPGKRRVQTAHRQWLEANAELFEALAERERLNTMIVFMQAGKTPNEAAALTTKILFDYPGSLAASETKSTWTGLLLTAIHPFWTWQKNANHFVVNALENPAVAYRMGVMRRAIETGPEAVSNAIFAMQVDPYGFDPNNMPPEARRVYFYMRQAYEESLEKEAWEMTEEERLTFAAFIWQNHPATPQMIRGDSVVSLDSQVRLKTKDKWEAMPDAGMIGPSGFAPPPNLDRVREWQRNRIRFMLRPPQTEAIRDYARITGQDDLMLSVVFYEPGTLGAANYLANVLNLAALPATIYNASGSSLQTGTEFSRAFDTVLNPERAPVFSQILAATKGQSRVRLAQPIAEMLEQRGGLDALLVSKQRDPVAEASYQADIENGVDESVAGAKYPAQYYASPALSTAIALTPALADVNRTGIRMENNGAFARMPTLAKVRTILMMTGWVSSIDETSMETAALDAQYDTPIKALPR